MAARHVVTLVREKHLESCFSLRLPLQELFDLLYVSAVKILRLKVPRATALCESRLAARYVVTLVREKHLESCFSLRLPLQELFDVLYVFEVEILRLKVPRYGCPPCRDAREGETS